MDQRKYKRVALFLGLLFLITIAESTMFYQFVKSVHETDEIRLGGFVLLDERLETEAVRILNGKGVDGKLLSQKERENQRQVGNGLERQYGYTLRGEFDEENLRKYMILMGMTFALGCIGIWMVFIKERSERKKADVEIERLKEKIHALEVNSQKISESLKKEENDTKSLITDLSHQLKTPIASLRLGCELAETTVLTEEEQQEFRKNEYEEVRKLENLLNSLMNLSKLEAKIIQLKPVKASLKNTLVNAVNSVYMKAFEKEIEIVMEEFEDRTIIHDTKWTAEAFVNVLDNGIKYSPKGTKIKIRAEVLISYMLIEIQDEGIGIPAKEAYKVFQRFYRGDNEVAEQQEGSGVGLYLTRKILEEQKGTISVKSGIPRGSVFQITLPLA